MLSRSSNSRRVNVPRTIAPPKSIADYGGLKAYLDSTKGKHNGLGYSAFWRRVDPARKHRVPRSVVAEDFGVSTRLIYDWLKILPDYWQALQEQEEGQLQ